LSLDECESCSLAWLRGLPARCEARHSALVRRALWFAAKARRGARLLGNFDAQHAAEIVEAGDPATRGFILVGTRFLARILLH